MGHQSSIHFIPRSDASTASEALRQAVADWRDNEANRFDKANPGNIPTHPLMTSEAALRSVDTDSMPVNGSVSQVVPVCADKDAVTATKQHKLPVAGEDVIRISKEPWFLLDKARELFGVTVIDATLVSVPRQRKAQATATEGKAITRYYLMTRSGMRVLDLFESQAAARAAGIDWLNSPDGQGEPTLKVRGTVLRDTGSADLVVIDRPTAEEVTVTVKVTTSTPKAGAKQTDWLVGFDYHR